MSAAEPVVDTSHIERADDAAFFTWAWGIYKRGRKPEGEFDLDSGKFKPTERESTLWTGGLGKSAQPNTTPRGIKAFMSWQHVWKLCRRARNGGAVPPDIEESFKTAFGKINAKYITAAVDEALKRETQQHVAKQRAEEKLAKKLEARSTAARILHREKQIERLDKLIKKRESQIAALQSRKSTATRSLSALKRSQEKQEKESGS